MYPRVDFPVLVVVEFQRTNQKGLLNVTRHRWMGLRGILRRDNYFREGLIANEDKINEISIMEVKVKENRKKEEKSQDRTK